MSAGLRGAAAVAFACSLAPICWLALSAVTVPRFLGGCVDWSSWEAVGVSSASSVAALYDATCDGSNASSSLLYSAAAPLPAACALGTLHVSLHLIGAPDDGDESGNFSFRGGGRAAGGGLASMVAAALRAQLPFTRVSVTSAARSQRVLAEELISVARLASDLPSETAVGAPPTLAFLAQKWHLHPSLFALRPLVDPTLLARGGTFYDDESDDSDASSGALAASSTRREQEYLVLSSAFDRSISVALFWPDPALQPLFLVDFLPPPHTSASLSSPLSGRSVLLEGFAAPAQLHSAALLEEDLAFAILNGNDVNATAAANAAVHLVRTLLSFDDDESENQSAKDKDFAPPRPSPCFPQPPASPAAATAAKTGKGDGRVIGASCAGAHRLLDAAQRLEEICAAWLETPRLAIPESVGQLLQLTGDATREGLEMSSLLLSGWGGSAAPNWDSHLDAASIVLRGIGELETTAEVRMDKSVPLMQALAIYLPPWLPFVLPMLLALVGAARELLLPRLPCRRKPAARVAGLRVRAVAAADTAAVQALYAFGQLQHILAALRDGGDSAAGETAVRVHGSWVRRIMQKDLSDPSAHYNCPERRMWVGTIPLQEFKSIAAKSAACRCTGQTTSTVAAGAGAAAGEGAPEKAPTERAAAETSGWLCNHSSSSSSSSSSSRGSEIDIVSPALPCANDYANVPSLHPRLAPLWPKEFSRTIGLGSPLLDQEARAVIATAALVFADEGAEIVRMCVHPLLQRFGVGAHLLQHVCESWSASNGSAQGGRPPRRRHIFLTTLRTQRGAIALYAKHGFSVVSEKRVIDGPDTICEVTMERIFD